MRLSLEFACNFLGRQPRWSVVRWCVWSLLFASCFATTTVARAADPPTIEFNRDIRPILADNCFACHGPDQNKREAELRLDRAEDALAKRQGPAAIVPGDPAASELVRRIKHSDPDQRMPPSGSNKSLSARQIALVEQWIKEGAQFQQHWSFIAPKRPAVPTTQRPEWVRNPIDAFILQRLEQERLEPSPDADRRTLARRLSFDLLGLPPTPEAVDAFVADASPKAYENFVDQLLASEHYGERMATYWLDVVRYADTGGYHSDNHRDLSPYRDYVIRAFNANLPFDQFTREQLAGDLLPNPTSQQRIASGYNRLLQTTEEGGAQPKEYTAKYAADRVRNTSVIWLGLTMGCSECHNHKFDPLTTREFYSMQAFFADIAEKAVGRQDQTAVPTPEQEQRLAKLDADLGAVRGELDKPSPELTADQTQWESATRASLQAGKSAWKVVKPEQLESAGGQTFAIQDDQSVLTAGPLPDSDTYTIKLRSDLPRVTGLRLETLRHESLAGNKLSRGNGNFVLTEVEAELTSGTEAKPRPIKIASAEADFSQQGHAIGLAIDGKIDTGWAVEGHLRNEDHKAVFVFEKPIETDVTSVLTVRLRHTSQFKQHHVGRFRIALTEVDKPALNEQGLPEAVVQALLAEPAARTPPQVELLTKHYRTFAPRLAPVRQRIDELTKEREALVKAFPLTLVSMSVAPRTVRVLPRGNWLDDSGEVVEPATPASLNPLSVQGRRPTRLDFADWLVAADNPLTARVFVNRLWKLSFGQGIVRTVEDLGTQGEWPTHPALLDWLAVEFRESGWNVKHLHKLLVMSHTYQQSSKADPRHREIDPNNRLLARQARFRIDAEFVRDNALAVSGLLARKIGGPSVKPYQPAGYWANLNFPTREWQNDHGADLYRRGLYTYWCRTFLQPGLLAFDAPSREECVAERPRSNTPLQALVLLNDVTYVEAARALAARTLAAGGESDADRLRYAMRQAVSRGPTDAEAKILLELVERHRTQFAANPAAAAELLKVGETPAPAGANAVELAAWTSAARAILNLHETVTRN